MDTELKTCTKCKIEKPISDFRSRGGSLKHLVKSQCNKCLFEQHRDWISSNPDRVKEYRSRDSWTLAKRCRRHGMSPEELITKYESQNGKCAIFTNDISLVDSAIDHNHATGHIRGVLCKKCNRALGLFGDSMTNLKNAYDYLKENGTYGVG